ncbi:MAG: glycosyltransferase family 2 protein [Planctomycetota bacterium]
MDVDLSVIIPVFNEEDNIEPLEAELQAVLETLPGRSEVIFVDDGSSDRSFERLREVVSRRDWARVVKMKRNFGQTQAMAAGFDYARGSVLICMDADLQNDPRDIPRLLERMDQGFDIVSGWRKDRKDKFLTRRFPSICANWLIGRIVGVRIHDYGCSLKAYDARVVKSLNLYSDMHRFLPALASKCGARVTEITVNHRARLHGESKYGLSRVFKVVIDIAVIKLIVDFAARPIHAFGPIAAIYMLAVLFTLPFFVINLAVGYRVNVVIPTIMVLFAMGALYFFGIGMLADLVVRVGRDDTARYARATAMELS